MNRKSAWFLVAIMGMSTGLRLRLRDIDFAPVDAVSTDEPSPAQTILSAEAAEKAEPSIAPASPDEYKITVTVEDPQVESKVAVSTELMDMCNCASAAMATVLKCDPPVTGCTKQ